MSIISRKLKTGLDLWRTLGVIRVFTLFLEKLLPRPGRKWLRLKDHWWIGKLVELSGNRVTLDGCNFDVSHPAIPTAFKTRFYFGTYEHPERVAIGRFLDAQTPVIELGGSIGVVSCLTNRRLAHPENHVVVEANPALLPVLQGNRDRNGCRFTILNNALGYGSAKISFHQQQNFTESSVHSNSGRTIEVPTTGIGRIIEQRGFKLVTLLCDVEGAEIDLVQNEGACLRRAVKTVIMEIHPAIVGEGPVLQMKNTLRELGFELVNEYLSVCVFSNRALEAEEHLVCVA